ncbi:MAG: FAD-dependent oxidoreductase [Bacteroidota bacterium]
MHIPNEISYWERDRFFDNLDFTIIGSGIVGLSTAIHLKLKRPQAKVLILERGPFPLGASTRNAGFACFGSMTEILDDLQTRPAQEVWSLVEQRYQGLKALRKLLGDTAIGYQADGGYEVFLAEDSKTFERCMDHREVFNKSLEGITGMRETFIDHSSQIKAFGFGKSKYMLLNQAEGSINTGLMMEQMLAKAYRLGIKILNGVEVEDFVDSGSSVQLITKSGQIFFSENVVIATNGFSGKLLPKLDVLPARNQVLITKPLRNLPFTGCFHIDRGYFYFRNVGNRVLFGGGRHLAKREETDSNFAANQMIRAKLVELLHTLILPSRTAEIDYWWSGILGVGEQKTPIIKRHSDSLILALRLGGMGVAIGTLIGQRATELLLE